MLNIGAGEAAVIGMVAVLVLGPDRLPRAASDIGRMLRQLRGVAEGAKAELKAELGPDMDQFRALDPRRMIREQLNAEDDDVVRRTPAMRSGPPPWDSEAT